MTLGVAVIGAGMAGRAHAAAYRIGTDAVRVDAADRCGTSPSATSAPSSARWRPRRFGYERSDTLLAGHRGRTRTSTSSAWWSPTHLHREMVEGLLAAGKHVLCEKPLSDTLDDARAMADVARGADTVARIGFTFRRAPGVAALRELVTSGALGRVLHVDARYWCDYASDPQGPISWRYKGAPGYRCPGRHRQPRRLPGRVPVPATSARSAAAGSPPRSPSGPMPLGSGDRPRPGRGQRHVRAGRERRLRQLQRRSSPNGVGVVQVSRVAAGHPNGLALEVFGDQGAAKWAQERPAEFQLMLNEGPIGQRGFRRVIIGPDHPYVAGGLPMDAPGVGLGQNDGFVYQARAFLEEVAGHRRGGLAAALRLVRRGRAQHGGARRGRRVGCSRRGRRSTVPAQRELAQRSRG